MTLQQLKYIVTVAEKGSITEAAAALFISQPSLSNAIKTPFSAPPPMESAPGQSV